MEPLSRVKKNAELRQMIENSRESELTSTVLTPYANRLNRINPELSTIDTSLNSNQHNPLHSKRDLELSFDPQYVVNDPAFHHDMLDEFIDEVKSYNIKRGYLSSEDTDLNILKTIAKSPQETVKTPSYDDDQMTQEIKKIINSDFDPATEKSSSEQNKIINVFEETAEIKLKLENVDKELLEMSHSVNSSSKTLNFIVLILVVVLLVMLGIAFYWIFWNQGI